MSTSEKTIVHGTDNSASDASARGSSRLMRTLTGEDGVTASQLFDRKGTSRLAVFTILSLAAILAAAIAWSSVMPVAEISVSSGEVAPSESVQYVQHLEGGIVSRLNVAEGLHVKKGDVLVELAPDIAQGELDQLRTRLATVNLRAAFLSSAIRGEAPPLGDGDGRYREIVLAQTQALAAMRESIDSQATVLAQQVNERNAELAALKSQMSTIDKQIVLTEERVSGLSVLVEKGHFPRMKLIEDERDLARLVGDRVTLNKDADRLAERIRESEFRISELKSKFQSELATELNDLTSEAAELRLTIDRAEDRVRRLKITAPVSGRVQGLEAKTIGGVIGPGDTIMNIVPDDAWPHVEARVSTRDIGYVSKGQEAVIKVLTYDYTRYGVLKGRVRQVSASTFTNEDGEPYYKAYIDLDSRNVGGRAELLVSPGMTVLADIITGEKTLLTYLLSPIIRSFDAAFHER